MFEIQVPGGRIAEPWYYLIYTTTRKGYHNNPPRSSVPLSECGVRTPKTALAPSEFLVPCPLDEKEQDKEKRNICLLLEMSPEWCSSCYPAPKMSWVMRREDSIQWISYNKTSMPMKNTFFSRFRVNANAAGAGNFFCGLLKRRAHAEV